MKNNDVPELTKRHKLRLSSRKFATKYSRVTRENNELKSEYVLDKDKLYLPPDSDEVYNIATKEPPFNEFHLVRNIELSDSIPRLNSLQLYRMLKLMYGECDVIGGAFSTLNKQLILGRIDWSYTTRIPVKHNKFNFFAEVAGKYHNSRFQLRFWSDKIIKKERIKYAEQLIETCLTDLRDALQSNSTIFVESDEIRVSSTTKSFRNIFNEKYHSAQHIFALAENADNNPEKKLLEFGENPPEEGLITGSIYYSSCVFFIIALEALFFLLYHELIKSEFRDENGIGEGRIEKYSRRATIKADYEVRLGTMHIFCDGFIKPIVDSEDLRGRLRVIMRFRNNTFHGNIMQEHFIFSFLEDGMQFFYSPSSDYRGKAKERSPELPFSMYQMNDKAVVYIKNTIDMIIKSIMGAMDKNTREWFQSWINEELIISQRMNE